MQQGMLLHTLLAPEAAEYFKQLSCVLEAELNVSAFKLAWQQAVDRHAVLRTAFVWEGVKDPIQVVHQRTTLLWEQHDWRDLSAPQQQQRLKAFLETDRERGFHLSKAPLMRCALIQKDSGVYQFVWSFHHILLDGWSMPLLLKEVFAFYETFCRGEKLHLDQPRPYRDFIVWLQKQNLSEAERFWRQYLRGISAPTPLGVDRSLSSEPKDLYKAQHIRLSEEVTAGLQCLARQHKLTLNTVVQGAWGLLLSRYTREDEVIFGATVSGRPGALMGVERMLGLFINTLPVRVSICREALLVPWLQELQAQQAELRQYENTPLVEIHAWSEIPRTQPLFESILVFENYPVADIFQNQDGSIKIRDIGSFERTNYPLTVMADSGKELSLSIVHDCRRLDAATITRMLGHLQRLLESIATHPELHISELPLLTEAERHQLFVEWNSTRTDYPLDRCIHELFEAQAERTPEAEAVAFEDRRVSYRELNRQANQLAHYLRSRGVQSETLVGVFLERSLDMLVGLLGILKAGGAYVPLDPAYPAERISFMIKDSRMPVVLTHQEELPKLLASDVDAICLDREWQWIAKESSENLSHSAAPEGLAYVIYTSGSAGKPKGVMVEHRSVVNLLGSIRHKPGMTSHDVVLAITTLSFDIAGFELYLPLIIGARVEMVTRDVTLDPARLSDKLRSVQATVMQATPATWRMLIDAGWKGQQGLKILCTGEALPVDLANGLVGRGDSVWNLYGPTETTIWSTLQRVERSDSASVPIGRPIANTQVYVLDRWLNPVPIGVVGELHIGGVGLARGYWNRPELTGEKFIPDPFRASPGGRLYKTGDLARYLPDGTLEFLSRIDHQVKIRGFRIELGEIEAVLAEHHGVSESVVLAREDAQGHKRLVAYVVAEKQAAPTVTELRNWVKERLPEYMVPSAFVMLQAIPVTHNGKVDRRALPVPDTLRPDLEQGYLAPRTSAEETLARIWADVLKLERVGVNDNFFELGGDSILGIQVISRANQAGLRLTSKQLFQYQTIVELATVGDQVQLIAAEQGVVTGPILLTPIQHWFFEQDLSCPEHWNQAVLLQLPESVQEDSLREAVEHILTHHDALRLRFTRDELGWHQFNAGLNVETPFVTRDLSNADREELGTTIEEVAAQYQSSLNLAEGPLFRVILLKSGGFERDRLLVVAHHLAIDGVSWRILLNDLQIAYKQASCGEVIHLPPKTTSFSNWASELNAYA
ncbi:MAG: non-ribosomal peptide synthetase, partial [Acidobacteria bacterium]